MVFLPNHLTPPLSVFNQGGDFGGDLQVSSSCGNLGTYESFINYSNCTFGDTSAAVTVALVGDSRAQIWLDDLNHLGRVEHFRAILLAKAGCAVPLATYEINDNGTVLHRPWAACTSFHRFLASTLRNLHPRLIIISSNYQLNITNAASRASPLEVQNDMTAFLRTMPTTSKIEILGGFPQPAPVANPTECLIASSPLSLPCHFFPSPKTIADNLAAQVAARTVGVGFIDVMPWFCTSKICPPEIDRMVPYSADAYEANKTYLDHLTGVLWSAIQRDIR